MAPVRTYRGRTRKKKRPWTDIYNFCVKKKDREESITVFNALFAENIKQQKMNLQENKKVINCPPVQRKSPIAFNSTDDDEAAHESTFDRILKGPMLQDPEPRNIHKSSEFETSSSGTKSSSSDPSYGDLMFSPVENATRKFKLKSGTPVVRKSKIKRGTPVVRKSKRVLQIAHRKMKNEGSFQTCQTSTPKGNKKCEEQSNLSVSLSPVKMKSSRILKENSSFNVLKNSLDEFGIKEQIDSSIKPSKVMDSRTESCAISVCDQNNKSSDENVEVSELLQCISSMKNLSVASIEDSNCKSLLQEDSKASNSASVDTNGAASIKISNGQVKTSVMTDTVNNVQKDSSKDMTRQKTISPIMFDSWDAGNSIEQTSSNQIFTRSSAKQLKSSFMRIPCRRRSHIVVPSDLNTSQFKSPSFCDVYRFNSQKIVGGNRSTIYEASSEKSETEITHEDDEDDDKEDKKIILSESLLSGTSTDFTARDAVLQKCCQVDAIPFSEAYTTSYWKACRKIGEGGYGEVFMSGEEDKSVLKIIPIEGSQIVNGEEQKKFEEILSEIVIAMELSNLRNGTKNRTHCFSEMKHCLCVKGKYPDELIKLWNDFDELKGSENDSPEMFEEDQLYIILELANGGRDLESYVFSSAAQSLSTLIQTAYALAVAEEELEFEHRDLHWGNVLISETSDDFILFRLGGKPYMVPTEGVQVTIIDFTLSRMTYDGCCIFNDLSKDSSLFTAVGDYQFEIYRLMKEHTMDVWNTFVPYTNILWLHYLIDKMLTMVNYVKKRKPKSHLRGLETLQQMKMIVFFHTSASQFVLSNKLSDI